MTIPAAQVAKTRMSRIWHLGQRGWPPDYPVIQFPNLPLLIAICGSILRAIDLLGAAGLWTAVYTVGIVVWALLELGAGANLFRRALGLVVLLWLASGWAGIR